METKLSIVQIIDFCWILLNVVLQNAFICLKWFYLYVGNSPLAVTFGSHKARFECGVMPPLVQHYSVTCKHPKKEQIVFISKTGYTSLKLAEVKTYAKTGENYHKNFKKKYSKWNIEFNFCFKCLEFFSVNLHYLN